MNENNLEDEGHSGDLSSEDVQRRRFSFVEPIVILVTIATLTAMLARVHWIFELASHFRVQYMGIAGICVCVLAFSRRWKMFWIAVLVFILNAAVVLPVYWPQSTVDAGSSSIKILSANLYVGNNDFEALEELIRETDPDIVIFAESHAGWMGRLEPLKHYYPHAVFELDRKVPAFSISAFSRIETSRFEIIPTGEPSVPSVLIETELDGKPIRMIGTHAHSPGRKVDLINRNNQLMAIAGLASGSQPHRPCAVLGDLNITPWSPYFSDFLKAGNFRDSRQGRGNQASWPTGNWLLRIPIDHCVTQKGIVVKRRELCRYIGSDHRPLLVELALE